MLWTAATVYLVVAAGFYAYMVKRAPVLDEPANLRTHPEANPQVLELFPAATETAEKRAA